MIEVEKNGKTFQIPDAPGIYKIEDDHGAFRVAHDGQQAIYLPGGSPSSMDLRYLNWRLAKNIKNGTLKVSI
jgi:hypothetical protein